MHSELTTRDQQHITKDHIWPRLNIDVVFQEIHRYVTLLMELVRKICQCVRVCRLFRCQVVDRLCAD